MKLRLSGFRIGDCRIDVGAHCLRFDGGGVVALQPKFVEVLACLALADGRVVPREQLIAEVWDANVYVGEKALTNAIWHLRKALAQGERTHDAIETVHKGGYVLRLAVEWSEADSKVLGRMGGDERVGAEGSAAELVVAELVGAELVVEKEGRERRRWQALFAALLPLLLVLAWFGWTPAPPQAARIRVLTSEPGRELFPRASPDGELFAYLGVDTRGRRDLFLRERRNPERPARRLTDDPEVEGAAVFSPDGLVLYYSRRGQDGACELMRLELASGRLEPLRACGQGSPVSLDVFPDGRRLVFEDGHGGLALMDLAAPGRPVRALSCTGACSGAVRSIAVSPDGHSLALSRRLGDLREDVFLMALESGQSRRLTSRHVLIRGLAWLADGERLVFSAENAKRQEGFILTLADGGSEPLGVSGFAAPSLVPGTNTVLYHDFAIRQYLGGLPLDGATAVLPKALLQSEASHHAPHYSPVADRIAYVSNESGFDEIWSAAADGSGRERLTNLRTKTAHPRWSLDGRHIAFRGQGERDEGDALYVLDVARKEWRQLPSPFQWHKRPTWSPDGKALIVATRGDEHEGLYRVALDGKTPPLLLADSARMGLMLRSGALYYTRNDAAGLWLGVSGQAPKRILDSDVFDTGYNWDADEQGVCFESRDENYHVLRCQSWADARTPALLKAPLGTLADTGSISLMRAHGQLLLTMDEYPQADIRELMLPE